MTYHPTVDKILSVIREYNVWYETFEHEPVRTSEEAANIRDGYSLSQGAKALIVKVTQKDKSKTFVMIVLPGDKRFNSKIVKQFLHAHDVIFATEEEIAEITDGVKVGGVPPFGNLFSLPVYLDKSMLQNEKIIFNAGDRSFSIGMFLKDYIDIVKPEIVEFV